MAGERRFPGLLLMKDFQTKRYQHLVAEAVDRCIHRIREARHHNRSLVIDAEERHAKCAEENIPDSGHEALLKFLADNLEKHLNHIMQMLVAELERARQQFGYPLTPEQQAEIDQI